MFAVERCAYISIKTIKNLLEDLLDNFFQWLVTHSLLFLIVMYEFFIVTLCSHCDFSEEIAYCLLICSNYVISVPQVT